MTRNTITMGSDGSRRPRHRALRVNRGGSWFDIAAEARSASRDGNMPGEHNSGLGFRLARTP